MKLGCGVAIALLAVLIVGGSIWAKYAKEHAPAQVTVGPVTRGVFVREVNGTGNVEAKIYTLSFTTPGRVARVMVHEQDTVAAGAVLAELDLSRERESQAAAMENISALHEALRAQAITTRNDQRKLNADLADARRKLRLARQLLAAGAESADAVRDLQRQVNSMQADLNTLLAAAESRRNDTLAQIAARHAEMQGTAQALRESALRAPVAGRIATVDFRVGEAAQGSIKLVQRGTLRVKAQIQEAEAWLLSPGMPARIELDADPDHPLAAVIDELGVVATVKGEGGSATLPVKFRFLEEDARARSGYTATARVVTRRIANAVQVPLEALVESRKDGARQYAVWIATPVGKGVPKRPTVATVAKKTITVTARNLTHAVVEGLTPGLNVVTLPSDTLKNGARVVYGWEKDENRQ